MFKILKLAVLLIMGQESNISLFSLRYPNLKKRLWRWLLSSSPWSLSKFNPNVWPLSDTLSIPKFTLRLCNECLLTDLRWELRSLWLFTVYPILDDKSCMYSILPFLNKLKLVFSTNLSNFRPAVMFPVLKTKVS